MAGMGRLLAGSKRRLVLAVAGSTVAIGIVGAAIANAAERPSVATVADSQKSSKVANVPASTLIGASRSDHVWRFKPRMNINIEKLTCATCWSTPNAPVELRGQAYDLVQIPLGNAKASDRERAAKVLAAADLRAAMNSDRPLVVVFFSSTAGYMVYTHRDPQDAIDRDINKLRTAGITHAIIAVTTDIPIRVLGGATTSLPGTYFSVIGVGADGRLNSSVSGFEETLAALKG